MKGFYASDVLNVTFKVIKDTLVEIMKRIWI